MKKGYGDFGISLTVFTVLIAISSVSVLSAWNEFSCYDGFSDTPCVCGRVPSSLTGYGQVVIPGGMNYSCDNTAQDGICPEDYQDIATGIIGNCSSCTDIDCNVSGLTATGYVWGYVRDTNGNPIPGAEVVGSPIKWNSSAYLDRNTTVERVDGVWRYNYSNFLTGRYSFKVSKTGYDTEVVQVFVNRSGVTHVDFTLQNGTCHSDCTNSRGRCNAACDGISLADGDCNFVGSGLDVTAAETKAACNNIDIGSTIRIKDASDGINSWYVDCCEGVPYLKYNAKADTSGNEGIKNLVKTEKIVRYNYEPSRLIIAYWR